MLSGSFHDPSEAAAVCACVLLMMFHLSETLTLSASLCVLVGAG